MITYEDYISSPEWKEKRNGALKRAGFACQLCKSTKRLNVHHNTYERLGNELDSDLVVLCHTCHLIFHGKRDERTKRRFELLARRMECRAPAVPVPKMPKKMVHVIDFDRTGKTKEITVDLAYLESLLGVMGSITARGLRLIGEETSLVGGWRQRCIGRKLIVDEGELAAEQEMARLKRSGMRTVGAKSHVQKICLQSGEFIKQEKTLLPHEIDFIVKTCNGYNIKMLSNKFGVSKMTIRKVSQTGKQPHF